MLAVTGSDLISWGMKPGKEVGDMLNQMLSYVIDDPTQNEKQLLKKFWENL